MFTPAAHPWHAWIVEVPLVRLGVFPLVDHLVEHLASKIENSRHLARTADRSEFSAEGGGVVLWFKFRASVTLQTRLLSYPAAAQRMQPVVQPATLI